MGGGQGRKLGLLIDQVRGDSRVDQGCSKQCGEEWSELGILKVELMDFLMTASGM